MWLRNFNNKTSDLHTDSVQGSTAMFPLVCSFKETLNEEKEL
jgi:hypothetical protein